MQTLLNALRARFAAALQIFRRKPKAASAVQEPATKPRAASATPSPRKIDRFTVLSWAATMLLVVAMLAAALLYNQTRRTATVPPLPQPTAVPAQAGAPQLNAPALPSHAGWGDASIHRRLQLKTNIPERPRYEPILYRVTRGDAMLSIAKEFNVKSESILFANPEMGDNPHNLKPGMELKIPPVDGLYYEWKEGDTFESVAQKFDANPDEIINFPGNHIDLTNPQVQPGTVVMIPGGTRQLRNWAADLATMGRGANTGTGGANATNVCGGGPVASGYGWPADDHTLSGNPYGPSHLGIDISAPEGSNVYAAGSGIVTMAQGGWNYGYGNVVQIDHGNGDVTVYAHLSAILVSVCQPVGQGALIGYSGNTGNSFGAHLHFEIRRGGSNINPYDVVQ